MNHRIPQLYDLEQLRKDFIEVYQAREVTLNSIAKEMHAGPQTITRFLDGGAVAPLTTVRIANFVKREKAKMAAAAE